MFTKINPKNVYLDYAATTPLDEDVKKAMEPYLTGRFGNPSTLYRQGTQAGSAVEQSRKSIAGLINARPAEIIFTAGGTESCNLAIFGVANSARKQTIKPHLIISAVEHRAVLNPVLELKKRGFAATILSVNREGFVDIDHLEKSVRKETILVSIMYANNEIGTIEPIAEIGKRLARINIRRKDNKLTPVIFHTDACQAAGFLDLNVNKLLVDLMSINGSKIYGPSKADFYTYAPASILSR